MKIFGTLIIAILFLLLCSCGHITQDKSISSIDADHLRVESIICGKHEVGNNGCIFPEGNVEGDLKFYAVNSGYIKLTGSSCNIDKKFDYNIKNGEWISIPLTSLVGPKLPDNCMIEVYQNITVPHQDRLKFPIQGMIGTVFLGICPLGIECSYIKDQVRQGITLPLIPVYGTEYGPSKYRVDACGLEVVPVTSVENFTVFSPQEKSCMIISSAKSLTGRKFKNFFDLHIFKSTAILMAEPSLSTDGKFVGDALSAINISNGVVKVGNRGNFDATVDEYFLRFYTSQGRSLVVALSKGVILWAK